MKVKLDSTPLLDSAERRTIQGLLGLFTLLDLDFGWSSSLKGKLLGRFKLPLHVPGFLWFDIKLLGKQLLLGSYQLS